MERTMIPMPPSHWVRLRQRRTPFGSPSTALKMLEPVVVKPETLSKKASVKPGIAPVRR